ncbi:MAG: hypothetical protein QM817_05080 [Archangium sp.]
MLVQAGDQFHLKRLRKEDGSWLLTSDNPSGPTITGSADTTPIARVEQVITPESIAPNLGTVVIESELATVFGLETVSARTGRYDGHLFIFLSKKGELVSPTRLRAQIDPRPGETAFVLARRPDDTFRYCGVGRWIDDDAQWQIADVDFDTWRALGAGKAVSRELPPGAEARAQVVIDALLDGESWLEQPNGRRARVLGTSSRGGLRVDGGEGGFAERTVSLTDIAWVVAAFDESRESNSRLDEALINRVRYLDGTPLESTRYIDSAWALAAWSLGSPRVTTPAGGATEGARVHDAKARALDAEFSVEPVGDRQSIVVEARGGTKGSGSEQNTAYSAGLLLILERLAKAKLRILDAMVETDATNKLTLEKRRLVLRDRPYPVTIDDAEALRTLIKRAQAENRSSSGCERRREQHEANPCRGGLQAEFETAS